jgi:N-acetylmuramoyl-L-alanine amidase
MGISILFSSSITLRELTIQKGELSLLFDKAYKQQDIRHFTLSQPYREVFDISHAHLAGGATKKLAPLKRAIRVAQFKKDVVRVVIESKKPYTCRAYKPLFSYQEFHISLPPELQSFQTPPTIHIEHHLKKTPKKKPYLISKHTPRAIAHTRHDLVVIDAGHGGHDSGAVGGGKKEKVLVLQIAKRLKKLLRQRGYRVVMTRDSDRFIKLSQRTKVADKRKANIFVSIHANSVPKKKRTKIQGVETFFLQTTRDAKSQRIAARENKAVLKGVGSNLSKRVIIDSVLSGPKIVQSNKLAIDVHRGIMTHLHHHYKGVKDGGIRHAPFWVLVGASCPSILVEVGYISHPRERTRLFQPRYQYFIAKGIADGIDNYLRNRKRELGLE